MKNKTDLTDTLAISFSLLCALHCLALPVALSLLPALSGVAFLNSEAFHLWMLVLVIPTSVIGLLLGCKQHRRFKLLFIGGIGVLSMVLAVSVSEHYFSHEVEKIMTLIGAVIISIAHYFNYRTCQNLCVCEKDNQKTT